MCELAKGSQLLIKEREWTIDFPGRYQEKGGELSSNFEKHKVLICEKEIRTVGSRGLWTIDLVRRTRKFGFWKD
jgi:hypothetical protein